MNLPLLAAVAAPIFIAASISAAKLAGNLIDPFVVAGAAPLVSVPFIFAWTRIRGIPYDGRVLFREHKRELFQLLVSRCVVGQILIVSGFILTTAAKAVLLLRLEPLFVLLWGVVLNGERPGRKKIGLTLLLIWGAYLVVAPHAGHIEVTRGDVLIILALLLLSYSYIPTKQIMSSCEPVSLSLLTNFCAGIVILLPIAILSPERFMNISLQGLGYLLAYSLLLFVFGMILYFYAFRGLAPWLIASFLSLEVVVGLLLAHLLFGENPTTYQYVGAAIMVCCTIASARESDSTTSR